MYIQKKKNVKTVNIYKNNIFFLKLSLIFYYNKLL